MRVSRCIPVPARADEAQKQKSLEELQIALDRVREFAESNVDKAGTEEFPFYRRRS
jgi:hypothetical protein